MNGWEPTEEELAQQMRNHLLRQKFEERNVLLNAHTLKAITALATSQNIPVDQAINALLKLGFARLRESKYGTMIMIRAFDEWGMWPDIKDL